MAVEPQVSGVKLQYNPPIVMKIIQQFSRRQLWAKWLVLKNKPRSVRRRLWNM
ncbi:MAG: hypothetical protein LBK66_08320 [Spirochaetaceae bacterium]|nr:hypothetical protein [Spirochaetaceae bacterium]